MCGVGGRGAIDVRGRETGTNPLRACGMARRMVRLRAGNLVRTILSPAAQARSKLHGYRAERTERVDVYDPLRTGRYRLDPSVGESNPWSNHVVYRRKTPFSSFLICRKLHVSYPNTHD